MTVGTMDDLVGVLSSVHTGCCGTSRKLRGSGSGASTATRSPANQALDESRPRSLCIAVWHGHPRRSWNMGTHGLESKYLDG